MFQPREKSPKLNTGHCHLQKMSYTFTCMTLREYLVLIVTPEDISISGSVMSFQVVTLERFMPAAQMLFLVKMF